MSKVITNEKVYQGKNFLVYHSYILQNGTKMFNRWEIRYKSGLFNRANTVVDVFTSILE